MQATELETQRLYALREIASGMLRLKCLRDATRFELAAYRHGLALKAGFKEDQPRVPRGQPEGGRWTGEGGNSGGGSSPGKGSGNTNRLNHGMADTQVAADNQRQNKMVRDIVVRLDLNKSQAQQLHREISGQGLGYHEILQIATDMFGK